jgi:hypothetical protein
MILEQAFGEQFIVIKDFLSECFALHGILLLPQEPLNFLGQVKQNFAP